MRLAPEQTMNANSATNRRLSPRERLLAPFQGVKPDRPAWVADLTYWRDAAQRAGRLEARHAGRAGWLQLHLDLGVCPYYFYEGNTLFAVCRDGVETRTEESPTRRVTRWRTPRGALEETWEYVPQASCWAHTGYAVSTARDLKTLQDVLRRTRCEPCDADYRRLRDFIGDAGLALCAAPRSPLPGLMTDWCGVLNTIYLIEDERAAVEDTLAVMAAVNDPAFEIIARGPAELIHFCDNLDSGNYGLLFERYMQADYRRRLDRLHAAGRYAVVHLDGMVRGLLPRLAACGFDGVESLTPLPVGDVAIAELRALAGNPRTILWGGIPGAMFAPPWKPDDVRAQTLALLDAHGRDGRLIVGSADQIPPDGDIRLCRLIADTIEAWRQA
jgi:hypothetical protein